MRPRYTLFFTIGLILFIVLVNNEQEKPVKKTIPDSAYASMLIPAVDDKGDGIITNLTVQVKQGEGRSLVDINDLFFWVDVQNSIRTAKDVAQKFTDAELQNYDIIYSIIANASAVEGPSAGAAIAIATITALENKTLRHDVLITGTIEPDGSIGKVGDVAQKAAAAKSLNATLFLVPSGQSVSAEIGYEKACKIYFASKICSSQWRTKSIDLEKTIGISVVEVKDISEAMTYMVVQ
ncbi:MAG: hypothetical protein HY515_00420 [Candidatus Aenigmarchaeota archaeon]|nr:hypothetical protein [Candidatus Aenigmarchaeota archaeon]